jgi:hypothetical protein
MSTAPTPTPPPQKSNTLLWVFGIAAVALLGMTAGGIFIVRYLVRDLRVSEKGQAVEIQTPAGALKVNRGAEEIGLPIYPGATLADSGASVELSTAEKEEQRFGVHAAKYATSDSVEKVDAWYRGRLGTEFERQGSGPKRDRGRVRTFTVGVDDIAYVSDQDDNVRIVALKKRGSTVEIALVRIGKRETQ